MKSIRRLAGQPKAQAPGLHAVLLGEGRQNADIYHYFTVKRAQGSSAVAQPVLSGPVLAELQKILQDTAEKKVGVQIVTVCLDEFASNNQVKEPWITFCREISHLISQCLLFITDAKRYDAQHNTTTLAEALKVLSKLCHVLICLSEKNEKLCSAIFNKCAEILCTIFLIRTVKPSLQELILTTLSALCKKADQQSISQAFKKVQLHLKYVAKMILDVSVDTQMSIYTILYKSVYSNKEAAEKAQIWFNKWPAIRDAFIESAAKDYSQGCGLFLDKLFDERTKSNARDMKLPSSAVLTTNPILGSEKTVRHTGLTKSTAGDSRKGADGSSNVSHQSTPQFPKPNVDWKNSDNLSSRANPLKARIQTPYHPGPVHKQNAAASITSSVSKPPSEVARCQTKPTQKSFCNETADSNNRKFSSRKQRTQPENFNISPKNKQFHSKRGTAEPFQSPMTLGAQSPLSVLGEEDHSSKVERWFSGMSARESAGFIDDEDVTAFQDEVRETSQKRPASKQPAEASKKMKMDVPPTPAAKRQPKQPAQPRASSGAVQFVLPSAQLKNNSSAKPQEKAGSSDQTSSTPGPKAKKRTLYSKSTDKGYLGDKLFLEGSQGSQPLQEQVSKPNDRPPKHWEQKVKDLKSTSQSLKGQVYSFGKTDSPEANFKLPSKAPPKKKTAKAPTIPPRFACLIQKPSRNSDKENKPPMDKSKQEIWKACIDKKPSAKSTDLRTPLKESTNHVKNNRQTNCIDKKSPEKAIDLRTPLKDSTNHARNNWNGHSTTTSISSKKSENTKAYSEAFTTPQFDSKAEEAALMSYSPIQDDSMEAEEPIQTKANTPSAPVDHLSLPCAPTPAVKPQPEHKGPEEPKVPKELQGSRSGSVASASRSSRPEGPSSSRKNKSAGWDSGFDTSDVNSLSGKEAKSSSTRRESANSQYLRMRLKDYLERAKNANTDMSANQNVVTKELAQIKSLVEQLNASVGRCDVASSSNELKLREQTNSLQGCSRYLEDETFPENLPASKCVDFSEFTRRIRAKSAERIRKLLQTVIDEDLPLSPPTSDSE